MLWWAPWKHNYLCHLTGDIPLYFLNTLRPRQNGHHFPDNIFKCIFLNENVWISIKISLNFVPKGPINNISALVQIMAWRQPGDKPLSEPMMVSLLTHICVTRPQWLKGIQHTNGYRYYLLPLQVFQTGNQQHMIHSVAMLAVPLTKRPFVVSPA